MEPSEENLPPVLKPFEENVQDISILPGQTRGNEFVSGHSAPAAKAPSESVQCEDAGEGDLLIPTYPRAPKVASNVMGPDGTVHVHGNNSRQKFPKEKIKRCKKILKYISLSHTLLIICLIIVSAIFTGVYFTKNYEIKYENKMAYNQVGNFTPLLAKINDERKKITVTQTPLKNKDHFEPYSVSEGSCEPNKRGLFEFSTNAETLLDHKNFSYIFEHQWLNSKSTVTVHITADFSNGATLDVYLYAYSCFIQIERCFEDQEYDWYLTVSASQPHFTMIVSDPDYYFLVVQSGDERQVYARWNGSNNFTYFSYDSSFSNICQVTEDNSSCDFEVEKDTCYFIEANGNNTTNSVFYQYNLNIATKMKKDFTKNLFFWISCILFFCTCICVLVCLVSLLILCVVKCCFKLST